MITYRRPNIGNRHGHNPEWHRLIVSGFPGREIADSVYPGGVKKLQLRLQRQLDDLRDIARIRRVLAETPTEGSTYREGKSLADAVRDAVEDPQRRQIAIAYLTRDADVEIQNKARAL
jgi:hypothetical protein